MVETISPRLFHDVDGRCGVKKGFVYSKTDDFSYNVVQNSVHVYDFQATLFHLIGLNQEKLAFKHEGKRYRLTDVHGNVVNDLLL